MTNRIIETIIVGAGHAGLSIGYYLKAMGIEHIMFERGRIGESWRSQRWNSFSLNTANRINLLPGEDYLGNDPDGFPSAYKFVSSLESYALKFQLPVIEQAEVIAIGKPEGEEYFTVSVSENGILKNYQSRQIIICSGCQNTKKIPAFAKNISPEILQLHTCEYKNASQLPDGAVLVVGSAQSGCQITEDLMESGRKVFLSTSLVPRIPRRYRGKDIMDWLITLGFFDLKTEDVTDPQIFEMKAPQISGNGDLGHTVSLQDLARKGAVILGRMENANEHHVYFKPNAHEHVRFADEFSMKAKSMIDEFILKNQLDIQVPEEDIADRPDMNASCVSGITSLRLKDYNINSIIWTTGFNMDFGYLKLPVFDKDAYPQHTNGISGVKGLYFLGIHWLRSRKSGIIFGTKEDAEFISEKVFEYAKKFDPAMAGKI